MKPPILQCARAVTLRPDSMYLHGLFELAEWLIRLPRPAHPWCFRDVHIGISTCGAGVSWPKCGTCCYPCAPIVFIGASCHVTSHNCSGGAQAPGICTPTAPEDLITLRRPAIPGPATLPDDC